MANNVNSSSFGVYPSIGIVPSLETEFEDLIFCEVDLKQRVFQDHFDPNEYNPENIQPHLEAGEPGYDVSTGTERGMYLLLLSDPARCKGLIKRDINQRVKAYDDFNILLLKICERVDDYFNLSAPHEYAEKTSRDEFVRDRVNLVKEKMNQYSFKTEREKSYYSKNLRDFADIYFSGGKWKKGPTAADFAAVDYFKNPKQYEKIRSYAISGNIISTIGPVNDLRFLKNRKISVVDTSNICEYSLINLQGEGDFSPIVIWTSGTGPSGTTYLSIPYSKILSEEKKREFDQLIALLQESQTLPKNTDDLARSLNNLILSDDQIHYTEESLKQLRNYVAEFIIQDDLIGPIDTFHGFGEKAQLLSLEQIDHLVKNPQFKKSNPMIRRWVDLTPHQYLRFCQTEGWQNEFKAQFSERFSNLPGFINRFREAGLEEAFRDKFGRKEFGAFEKEILEKFPPNS